jgi:hypothetical protein
MGASGVMVIVPALTLFLDFTAHKAIGTSLLVDVIAALVTSYTYHQHHNVNLRAGLWMAFGGVVGAQLGSKIVTFIPEFGLGGFFGIFLVITGIVLWCRGRIYRFGQLEEINRSSFISLNKRRILASLALGLLIGTISGLIGAGGGIMFLLVLIFILGYPMHLAIGTSTLIMAITAASGSIGYAINGNIDAFAALLAGLAAVIGSRAGATIANRLSGTTLVRIIGSIFVTLGVAMCLTLELEG